MEKNFMLEIKLFVTALFAGLTAWLGALAVPVYILVLLNVIDYGTGYAAAPYRGEKRNSNKGFRGIAKKVCMWVLVGMGAVLDWLIGYAAATIAITLPFNFLLGSAVAIWLICNEVISILENIGDIGVKVPGFLQTIIEWIQKTTEDKTDFNNGPEVK